MNREELIKKLKGLGFVFVEQLADDLVKFNNLVP